MTLFLSMLPIYLFGNLHCAGMCGPLVLLLANRKFKGFYFLGRLASFSFMGLLSAEIGKLLSLEHYHISAAVSFIFGAIILVIGVCLFFRIQHPGSQWFSKQTASLSRGLARLTTNNGAYATFLFGVSTILLPCGQTLVVFSACALNGDPLVGLINGFLFAVLTSPALIATMYAFSLFRKAKRYYHTFMGMATIVVGLLACMRGFADLERIDHLTLNPNALPHYHIVLY